MKVQGTYAIKAPQERVWELLLDPQAIAKCIPGCQGLEPTGPNQYRTSIRIGVAAVQGTYQATVRVADVKPMSEYKLQVEGQGGPGFVKGEARIKLTPGAGRTDVVVAGEAQVGGSLAAVGQRLGSGVATLLLGDFFKRMKRLAEAQPQSKGA